MQELEDRGYSILEVSQETAFIAVDHDEEDWMVRTGIKPCIPAYFYLTRLFTRPRKRLREAQIKYHIVGFRVLSAPLC